MRVPSWFVIGCGLLLLNALAVVGATLTRHAIAEPPVVASDDQPTASQPGISGDDTSGTVVSNPRVVGEANRPVAEVGEVAAFGNVEVSTEQLRRLLPEVPSLEDLPAAANAATSSILGVEDFKRVFAEQSTEAESVRPPHELPTQLEDAESLEQLSQNYFEALQLRLKSVTHLNQASQGLVAEAKVLFHRGEIREAKELLGMAIQLRETAAKLLVTRQ